LRQLSWAFLTLSAAILFTPICAHTLSSRPLLLPDGIELRIRVSPSSRCTAFAAFDGHGRQELLAGDTLALRISPYPLPAVCAFGSNEDFFRAANAGLFWSKRLARSVVEIADSARSSADMRRSVDRGEKAALSTAAKVA
jgi:NAD+ kinase